MHKLTLLVTAFVFSLFANAQDDFPYTFNHLVDIGATETKDQCNTGTCWSYATLSFLESELLRMGKGTHNLSEMYNVRVTYPAKAENYVRFHGKAQFSAGSLSHDVINVIEDFGVIPESVYSGLNYGVERHDHSELDALLDGMVKQLVEKNKGKMSPNWTQAVGAVLDVYLGEIPESFQYNGETYTPTSLRDELGIKASNYVSLSSFTHHPFHETFILEVPDNFSQGSFHNVPMEEMMAAVENALSQGYTVAWDADVSEKGFSFRNGMAIAPAAGVTKDQLFKEKVAEMKVTQEIRQDQFDSYQTTDDHLMHITGVAEDQDGNKYFIIKNSWGTGNSFNGYQYVSMSYFNLKTISVMMHKDAVPKGIKKSLGI